MTTAIELVEYQPYYCEPEVLPEAVGTFLWQQYPAQLAIEFPTPKTAQRWRLTAQGWVGIIPAPPTHTFFLYPKVALQHLFEMLRYAYNLHSVRWLDGLVEVVDLPQLYTVLADILAQRVWHRLQQGIYRSYVPQTSRGATVRGRLQQRWPPPVATQLQCRYDTFTADLLDNHILAFTLAKIGRSGLCPPPIQRNVQRVYRALQGMLYQTNVTYGEINPADCVNRVYHRLNKDYEPLHALCRFFLTHSGPGYQAGQHKMLPFLINMAHLYERYVAAWLEAHLPPDYYLKRQERVDLDVQNRLYFQIDLVLYHRAQAQPIAVLDTKYKVGQRAHTDDVAQILAYAQSKGSRQAILIYPTPLAKPLDTVVGDVRLRSLTFSLDALPDVAGNAFWKVFVETK